MRSPYSVRSAGPAGHRIVDTRHPRDPFGGVIATAYKRSHAELIVKALNRLPETETALRNERLTERRRINNSPEGETT